MNIKLIALAATSIVFALLAGSQWLAANNQRQQIASFESYVSDLQAELAAQGTSQIEYETHINELRRELQLSTNRISSLELELAATQEQIDPEIALLEQQIRERVILELRQTPQQTLSRTELVKQLNNLDPMELGQLMSLQGMYGGFLQRLDVDDGRMEVLIDGIGNIIEEQNQRRFEMISEMRNNPDNVENFRQQMFALNGPEAQRDALSFLLTDDELAVYDEFRDEQQQSGFTQSQAISLGGGRGSRMMMISGQAAPDGQAGQGQSAAIRIISDEPVDN